MVDSVDIDGLSADQVLLRDNIRRYLKDKVTPLIAKAEADKQFPYEVLTGLRDFGYLGVKVFFVISGYLITRLLIAEHARTGRISLRGFYVRRVWRIFPAFYAFVGAMLAAWAIGWIALAPGDVVAALTYTMNYHYERSWGLGHIWSLSIEEQFYLVWPFLFLALGRTRVVATSIVG